MVVLNKIYTKTGDKGETSLGNGTRVAKHSLRVTAYGTTDELNSFVGLARLSASDIFDPMLARIQHELFDIGADLCRPEMHKDDELPYTPLRMIQSQVDRLESEIDDMNAKLSPLRSFILPGGSELATKLHLCRTISRRAERVATELSEHEDINRIAVRYLNRLSDWFFVAARVANNDGKDDVLWVPGSTR